jgi:hypothetical protein
MRGTRDSGSYEVKFPDGRPSVHFYWDDNPDRRATTQAMSNKDAFPKGQYFCAG